jgi:beta-galactosidase
MPESIFIGTVYNIFHDEFDSDQDFFDQVDRDFKLIKESGITHVLIFPMSQWDPDTKELLWTRTDYLIKKIEDMELKFIPLMLKEEQCSHYFPIWEFKKIEGMWEKHNINNGNKNNRENVDFADPRIYPFVEKYFKAVIDRYGDSPALAFYNIWNEPHYKSDAPHVIERYKKWLKKKYGNLQELRRVWSDDYTSWDEVTPFLNDNWNSSMPQIDWIMFQNELNGILLGELVQTLRKYDTIHPVNANPVSTPWATFYDYGFYNVDNWPLAEYSDFHGISYYPDSWERANNLVQNPFWRHNLAFNTVRCASGDKNYILTELFTNAQNGLALNGYLTKDFVRLLAWTAIANDCKGIVYWKWLPFKRGRQSLGRGLCGVNGELAPRGEAVRDIAGLMKEYGEILFKAEPEKSQVAVIVDMSGLLKTLEQSTEPATRQFMFESNAGIFKALYEKNIGVDMLRADRGITIEQLKNYKIIFLPFQIVMRKNIAELLKEYVKQGGRVVADARTAVIDENDFAYEINPGAGLDELFGVERRDWTGKKGFYKVEMIEKAVYPPEFDGRYFRESLKLKENVEVIAQFPDDSEPAIVEKKYGKGTAVLSAVPLGASYYGNEENPVDEVIQQFTEEAGVSSNVIFISDSNDFLDIKVHRSGEKRIVYVINSETSDKNGRLEINTGNFKTVSVKDIITGTKFNFELVNNRISIPINVKSYDLLVLLIE